MATIKNCTFYLFLLIGSIGYSFADDLRSCVKETYTKEIGTRELTGRNDGKRIRVYLKSVGLSEGYSYCAAFVSYNFQQCGVKHPISAWAPSFFPAKNIIYKSGKVLQTPQAADVFGLYYPAKKRIAHVGFIDQWGDKIVITVEANTNEAGSREGDGVYRKRRLTRQIYAVSKFINQ